MVQGPCLLLPQPAVGVLARAVGMAGASALELERQQCQLKCSPGMGWASIFFS